MSSSATDLQQLLAEEPFVRALAHQLLADEADDVVQQAFLLALQRGAEPLARPRSWLARVVRNLATDQRRQRRHRAERERCAALVERVPSAAALAELEERRRALVNAVNDLPPALRTLVLLRYYEGLPPRRIAAALDLPVAVVWERLRQTLKRLRRCLDAAHGDDRRAWLLPLVPLSVRPRPLPWRELLAPAATAWTGVLAMTIKSKLATVAVVLVLLAAVWVAWPRPQVPPSAPPADRTAAAETVPGDQPTQGVTPTATNERAPVRTPESVAATTGNLLVRVRYADEPRPAAEVPVILNQPGGDFRVDVLRSRTDAHGTARFDAVPAGSWEVTTGRALGPKTLEIAPGQQNECALDLPRGMTLSGIVVDGTGTPVAGAWIEIGQPWRRDPEVMATTGADGTFALRSCPSPCLVGARAAGYASSSLLTMFSPDGATTHVRLELVAPGGMVEGLVVDGDGMPVAAAVVRVGDGPTDHLLAIAGAGPPLPAQVRTDTDGEFRAIGVPVGPQPVQVRAAGFAPWRGSCEVGADLTVPLRVTLSAGARCEGTVVTADSAPLANVTVRVGDAGDFVQLFARTAADGSFTLDDLPAGEVELRVVDKTHGKASARVTAVPGGTAHCELRLSNGQELRGRVVDEADQPVAGLHVRVAAEGTAERRVEDGLTDQDGRFHARFLPAGCRVTVRVFGRMFDPVRMTDIDPAAGEVLLRVQNAPRSARIRGVVLGVDGEPAGNITVEANWQQTGGVTDVATAADGSFEVGPLRTGRWRLRIIEDDCAWYRSPTLTLAENATVELGTIRLYRGGTLRAKVVGAEPDQLAFVIYDDRGELVFGMVSTTVPLRSLPLNPGGYELRVRGKGFAAQRLPFAIRDGEETELQVVAAPGTSQRFEFQLAAGDTAPDWFVFDVRRGDRVISSRAVSSTDHFTAECWLAPGDYEVAVKDSGLRGSARFTVGREPGPPVVVPVAR